MESGFYYRGYYYDIETGLYYLNSRYYDPEIGRFLNADGLIDNRGLNTQNLYSYCANNPVNRTDGSGDFWRISVIKPIVEPVIIFTKGFVEKLLSFISQRVDDKDLTSKQVEDRLAIAQTIIGEAGGRKKYDDWKQGQEAVAWVIINRYLNSSYPDDWLTIVSSKKQFTGYLPGKSKFESGQYDAITWDYAYQLAGYMVTGYYDYIPYPEGFNERFTRFCKYVGQNGSGIVIGGNYFYENK